MKLNQEIFSCPNTADDNGEKKTCDAPDTIFPDEKQQWEASYGWMVNQRHVQKTFTVSSNH